MIFQSVPKCDHQYSSLDELEIIKLLEITTHNNDIILAKGSNSTKINTLVQKLLKTKKEN